jgi:vacuolar-type H+-ATPase subunit I/STV1
VLLLLACLSLAYATEIEQFFGPAGALPDAASLGYVPTTVPYDNPGTLSKPTPTIPSTPDCTVRPQTIVEIKRMRRAAARIAQMIQTEVIIMEKRKTYVEQMTAYLNDRIRELNKVKSELDQENRWIELSNQRIKELAEKEKLIKMEDILACLRNDQERLAGAKLSQTDAIQQLTTKTSQIQQTINQIQQNIRSVSGTSPAAQTLVGNAGGGGLAGMPGGAVPGGVPGGAGQ